MYKIEFSDIEARIEDYLMTSKFMEEVGKRMEEYKTKAEWEYKYYGNETITLKVQKESVTYRFLDKYSKQPYLRKLLAGDFEAQMEIIKDVYEGIPDYTHPAIVFKEAFIPIRPRIGAMKAACADFDKQSHDDFNSIIRHIFEKSIYDGKKWPYVDKTEFVKRLGLRVCPYCGRNYIYGILPERDGKNVKVKPQIDHLLPKSIYPFLAANFYNLIPSCTQCNMEPAKGDQDTLNDMGELIIQHPYKFDDSKITFTYDPNAEEPLNSESIEIKIDFHGNTTWEKGYHDLFFLDEFYKKHNLEAHDIYVKLKSWYYDGAKRAYEALGVPVDYWKSLPLLLFGYHFTKEESTKRILFKFTHDIYKQMLDDFNTGKIR